MIAKRKNKLNSDILGVTIMRDFKYRGKFNRMWNMRSVTIDDIINTLYRNYKHLLEKQKHDTSEKILSTTLDKLFKEEVS